MAAKPKTPAAPAKAEKPAAKKAAAPVAKKAAAPAAEKAAMTPASKKTAAAASSAKKPPTGLAKPVQPSKELAAIVGDKPLPRTEVIAKIWDHIRKEKLQNPDNKREIIADTKLKAVFGQDKATMFEMNKLLSPHLK